MKSSLRRIRRAAALGTVFAASSAFGALTSITLPGATDTDVWPIGSLTAGPNPGYPSFPGSGAWPAPIGSATGGDATLNKTANGTGGGPYPASEGLYYGGFSGDANVNGGTLTVSDATPLTNLSTVVFQVEIGESWTYDFFNHELPTLSYNGGTQSLAATYSSLFDQQYLGTIPMPSGDEPIYRNTYALQWDLNGIADPITSFSVSFTGVQHAQLLSLQLDQSDAVLANSVLPAAVPEPSALLLAGACAGLAGLRRRRA